MRIRSLRVPGEVYLLLAAMIWGGAFVAQSLGADTVPPLTFNAARSLVGAAAIAPMFLVKDRLAGGKKQTGGKTLLLGGLICGVLLSVAVNLQQLGIAYTPTGDMADKANVGKTGFLTTLYIVLVPILGMALRRRAGLFVWLGALMALCGLYLLCVTQDFQIHRGDLYVIGCAFAFALQILAVDVFAPRVDCLRLSALQFLVCGLISLAGAWALETVQPRAVLRAWAPILFTGVMSSALAYTFQILGQKSCKPALASLFMSLESVFSALFGFLIMGQTLALRELIGCAVMLGAVLVAQIQPAKKTR